MGDVDVGADPDPALASKSKVVAAVEAPRPNFKEHLIDGPKVDDFVIERDADVGRPIGL
jgi:hypothetical protein